MSPRPSRSTCLSAAFALAAAMAVTAAGAFWCADGRKFVVETDADIAIVDAASGRITRAFPRRVMSGFRADFRATKPLPARPASTRGDVILSRDGGRLLHVEDGVNVWNVASGRLELRIPKAFASALLGEGGEQVAVSEAGDGFARRFSVLDVATGRRVYSRLFLVPGERVGVIATGSDRHAAMTVAQRELWTWSPDRPALERVTLPREFFVNLPMRFDGDGSKVAISGSAVRVQAGAAPRGRIAVFSTGGFALEREMRGEPGNPPMPLGWTRGGEFLVANEHNSPDLMQYDARTGELRHRWQYDIPLEIKSTIKGGPFMPRRERRLLGGKPARGEDAVLAPAGDRLALTDAVWGAVVAWDVTVTPPRRLPDLCGRDECGTEPWALGFSPRGGELMVYDRASSTFFLVGVSGAKRHLVIDGDAARASGATALVPETSLATCPWDPAACVKAADEARSFDKDCRDDAQRPACGRKRPWLKAACAVGDSQFCAALAEVGRNYGDGATRRLGMAMRCRAALEPPAKADARARRRDRPNPAADACRELAAQPLAASERDGLRADCDAWTALCPIAAMAAEQASDAALATELATRACEAGMREGCLTAARVALAAKQGERARAHLEQACLMLEDEGCFNGLRDASRLVKTASARQPGAAVEAPQLCGDLAYLRVAAVPAFEDGAFVGIRLRSIVGDTPGQWPFAPGDVLLNSVRCDPDRCTVQGLLGELNHLCGIPRKSLLHELRLEVRSTVPARNRDFVLRK